MFETMMHEYFFQMLVLIVCAAAAALGYGCRKLYKQHVDSQEKEAIAISAAAFVEQTFRNLHGYDKLMKENPGKAMTIAVNGMLPDNTIGRKAMTRLRCYAGAEHNNAAQKPVEYKF